MKMRQLAVFFCLFVVLSCTEVGYAIEPIVIEFFFYEPCAVCSIEPEQYEMYVCYVHNRDILQSIQEDYGSKVTVNKIPFFSEEGQMKIREYGLGLADRNIVVINRGIVFSGYINETYLRESIDECLTDPVHDVAVIRLTPSYSIVELGEKINITVTAKNFGIEAERFSVNVYCNESLIGTELVTGLAASHELSMIFMWDTATQNPGKYVVRAEAGLVDNETNLANNILVFKSVEIRNSPPSYVITVMLAISFGFLETFSPCLIVLLSFALAHIVNEMSSFRKSFLQVVTFGVGFISATVLLGVALGMLLLSTPLLHNSLTWIICIFAIFLGLNSMGVLRIPPRLRLQSKPLILKIPKKYVTTYAGLLLLGFMFYFLDPCIAPIFTSITPLLLTETFLFILSVFCVGAMIPFIFIGVLAGSISRLVRNVYRQRSRIRAISGFILISYAFYLVVFHLIPGII